MPSDERPANSPPAEPDAPQPCADVHCHVLPGVDDGPTDLAESLALCRMLVADGVVDVVASPHQLGPYELDNSGPAIRAALAALQAEIDAAGISLRLHAGADVRIDERLVRLIDEGTVLTIGDQRRHLLLELPHETFVEPLPVIEELAARGVQTVMTHPERHRYLAGSRRRIAAWLDAGAVLQITAGSLVGDFGRQARDEAWRLVDEELVDLVASDAHDSRRRPPRMQQARELLAARYGMEYARRLTYDNPRQVLAGRRLGD